MHCTPAEQWSCSGAQNFTQVVCYTLFRRTCKEEKCQLLSDGSKTIPTLPILKMEKALVLYRLSCLSFRGAGNYSELRLPLVKYVLTWAAVIPWQQLWRIKWEPVFQSYSAQSMEIRKLWAVWKRKCLCFPASPLLAHTSLPLEGAHL